MNTCLIRTILVPARSLALPALLLLASFTGCDGSKSPPQQTLFKAPVAPLDRLEEAIQESIREEIREVDVLLERSSSPDALAEALGGLGKLYHRNRIEAEAEICYREAARLQPDDPRWPYFLGRLLYKWNRLEEAAAAFEDARKLDPETVANVLWLAEVQLALADFAAAEERLNHALELSEGNARAHYGLGRIASFREDWPKAVEHFRIVLEQQPDASEVAYPLGIAYRALEKRELADKYLAQRGDGAVRFEDPLGRALSSKKNEQVSSRALLVKATSQVQAKRYGRAEKIQQQALDAATTEEDRIAALAPLGTTQVLLTQRLLAKGEIPAAREKLTEAIRNLQGALEADPTRGPTWFFLGRAFTIQGDNQQAIEALQTAVEQDGSQVRSHQFLADALRRAGRFEEALEHSQRVIALESAGGQGLYFTALTLVRLGRFDEACSFLEDAHRSLPNDPNLTFALSRVLAARPRTPEDLDTALELCKIMVTSTDSAEIQAIVASQKGDFEAAAAMLTELLEVSKANGMPILEARVKGFLETVEKREKITAPWPPDSPPLRPAPLKPL